MSRTARTPVLKYRITAKRTKVYPSAPWRTDHEAMPYRQDFADARDDALIKAHTMQTENQDDLDEIVLAKAFRQGGAMRWRYDISRHTLELTAKFDKAQGTGDLLEMA